MPWCRRLSFYTCLLLYFFKPKWVCCQCLWWLIDECKGPHPRQRFQSQPRCAARSRLRLLLMVCPHTQRPICSIFLSWIAVLNNVRPRLWWPGEYSIVFRGTTDKIWSLLPIHHSNLNRDFKLRPPNIRKFWSTATATAICKLRWWLRLTEPIHGEIWSRLPLEIAVAVEDRCRGWGPLGTSWACEMPKEMTTGLISYNCWMPARDPPSSPLIQW